MGKGKVLSVFLVMLFIAFATDMAAASDLKKSYFTLEADSHGNKKFERSSFSQDTETIFYNTEWNFSSSMLRKKQVILLKFYNPKGEYAWQTSWDIEPEWASIWIAFPIPVKGTEMEYLPGKWKIEVYFNNHKEKTEKINITGKPRDVSQDMISDSVETLESDFDTEITRETSDLIDAVLANDVKSVRSLIGKGANAKVICENNQTLLMIAAEKGYSEIVNALLVDTNINIDARDATGWTALMKAIRSERVECAKLLIDEGADVSLLANNGISTIGIAYETNNSEIIDLLEKAGGK